MCEITLQMRPSKNSDGWEAVNPRAKIYRQKDQTAMTVDHIEKDCDFVGEVGRGASTLMVLGVKYWIVIPKSETERLSGRKSRGLQRTKKKFTEKP